MKKQLLIVGGLIVGAVIVACSQGASEEDVETSEQALEAGASYADAYSEAGQTTCRRVRMVATYKPPAELYEDAFFNPSPALSFAIPASIPFVDGTAGGSAQSRARLYVTLAAGGSYVCTYSPDPTKLKHNWLNCQGYASVGTVVTASALQLQLRSPNSSVPLDSIELNLDEVSSSCGIIDAGPSCENCSDNNPCTTDTCTWSGCSHTNLATGSSCSDGDACNGDETCSASAVCTPGTPPVVDDGNPCTTDSCLTWAHGTPRVSHQNASTGTSCSTGNACLTGEVCNGSGACGGGTAVPVDDTNPCTDDSCNPSTGVHHYVKEEGSDCSDRNVCNGLEECNATGNCLPGIAPSLDDGNPCTVDSCDSDGFRHVLLVAGSSCSDGNVCNGAELCNSYGNCLAGTPLGTDDSDPCTIDTCDPLTGGVGHSPAPEGASCADSNECDGAETCNATGQCVAGTPPSLDDGNPCTTDSCAPVGGIAHTPVTRGTSCADANVCDGAESCNLDGICEAGIPPNVTDENDCTTDSCVPGTGIVHTPLSSCTPSPDAANEVLERRAAITGRIVDASHTALTGFTVSVFDEVTPSVPRTDVSITNHSDGSFKARLTSFPDGTPYGATPVRVFIRIEAPGYVKVHREAYLIPTTLHDLGDVVLMPRDSLVTTIGPAGGVAHDSLNRIELVFPPGAVASPIPVQITPFTARDQLNAPLPQSTLTTFGYDLYPDGQTFSAPVLVRIANYMNAPTTFAIPSAYYDQNLAEWIQEGVANWNASKSRFEFETTHFSPHDTNLTGVLIAISARTRGENGDTVCGGSTIGLTTGTLAQHLPLPTYKNRGRDLGFTLNYSSGLAGSRRVRSSTSGTSNSNQSQPSQNYYIPAGSSSVTLECAPEGSGGGGSPGSCSTGIPCSLSSVVQVQTSYPGQSFNSQQTPGSGATSTDVDGWMEVPTNPSGAGPASPGFIQQNISAGLSVGGGGCGGSGAGTFGPVAIQPIYPTAETGLESAPFETSRNVFMHHRIDSAVGAGWAIEEVNRLYPEPNADHVVLARGDGNLEHFRPRASQKLLAGDVPYGFAFSRDPITDEILAATHTGKIVKLAEDGSSLTLRSGLPFNQTNQRPISLAIAYEGLTRHFVVATRAALLDIKAAGAVKTLRIRPTSTEVGAVEPSVAASGDIVAYTEGYPSSPILYRTNISDATPVVAAVSLATAGNVALDPRAAVTAVQFGNPSAVTFGADKTLYIADQARSLIYKIAPAGSAPFPTTGGVFRFAGGSGSVVEREPGEVIPVLVMPFIQPKAMTTAPDGSIYVGSAYALIRIDVGTQLAEMMAYSASQRSSDMVYDFVGLGETRSIVAISRNVIYYDVGGQVVRAEFSGMASELNPARRVNRVGGGFELVDTSAHFVEGYDGSGLLRTLSEQTGEPIRSYFYEGTKVSHLVDPDGHAIKLNYSSGKLDSVTYPDGRTVDVTVNAEGDLASYNEPDGSEHEFAYDAHHMLVKRSPRGDETHYEYTSDGLLSKATKPTGEVTLINPAFANAEQWSATNGVERTGDYTDAHGVQHFYTLDDLGSIAKETFTVDGVLYTREKEYAPELGSDRLVRRNKIGRVRASYLNGVRAAGESLFDENGRLIRVDTINPLQPITFTYDANGWLIESDQQVSWPHQVYERDLAGHLMKVSDVASGVPTGREISFTYRSDGQLSTVTEHGLTTTFAYEPAILSNRNLKSITDSLGRTVSLTRDAYGNVTHVTDGTASSSSTYDVNNRITSVTDGASHTTTFGYTQLPCACADEDRVTSIRTPDLASFQKWQLRYGPGGRLSSLTDPDGDVNNLTDGHSERYEYETTGELKKTYDRLNRISTATHDAFGRVKTKVDAIGRVRGFSYPTTTTGQGGVWAGAIVGTGSNSLTPVTTSLASSTAIPDGAYQIGVSNFVADGFAPRGSFYRDATMQFSYYIQSDALGATTSVRDRASRPLDDPDYIVGAGEPTAYEDERTYDVYFDWPVLRYRETGLVTDDRRVTDAINAEGDVMDVHGFGLHQETTSHVISRDVTGRIMSVSNKFVAGITAGGGQTFEIANTTYTYRPDGRVGSVTDITGTRSFTYDGRGLVATMTTSDGTYTFEYDTVGRNNALTYPDGHERHQVFDKFGRVTQRGYEYPSNGSLNRLYTATYDAVGNPLTLTDPEGTTEYTYDADLDRLTSATRHESGQADVVETYAYNALGGVTTNAGTALNLLRTKLVGGGTAPSGLAATFGGSTITHNGGFVTAFNGLTIKNNLLGRPYEFKKFAGSNQYEQLGYDPYLRIASRVFYSGSLSIATDEEYYVYDEFSNISGVIDYLSPTSGLLQRSYLSEGTDAPLSFREGSTTTYYEVDLAGNVRRLRGPNGSDLGGYKYTAFGQDIAPSGMTPAPVVNQPLRWKARWRDEFTGGLYDMRARWWAPQLASFLEVDQLGYQDPATTLFGWPDQNPVKWRDPSGRHRPGAGMGNVGLLPAELKGELLGDLFGAGAYFSDQASHSWQAGEYGAAMLNGVLAAATGLGGAVVVLTPEQRPATGVDLAMGIGAAGVFTKGAACGAAGLSSAESWGNPASLGRHFADHGADFGSSSAEAYAKEASSFLMEAQESGFPTKIDSEGVIRVFDPATDRFGAYNPDGTTRTYFTPSSPSYFSRQPGVEPWEP